MKHKQVIINKTEYAILAEGSYVTKSEPDKPYKKYKLNDNKILVVSESEDFAYFGEDFGDLGLEIGGQIINYKGKKFKLANHDYQLLKSKDYGEPEGDVVFWDYENRDEIISLGIDEKTKKRSDVVGKIIDFNNINFIDSRSGRE